MQNDGTPGSLPVPGDVLSYTTASSFGHTSVVLATDVDSSGDGTITTIEQNFSAAGEAQLTVSGWKIQNGVKDWLHHTLDVWPQSGPPGSSVLVYGEGFQPNEVVKVNFDVSALATVTADSNGTLSTTITVPSVDHGQHYVFLTGTTTTPIAQTVFYYPN